VSVQPRFVVVSLAQAQAAITAQGATSPAAFRRLFLEPYAMEGERHHPGTAAVVHGVLVASYESAVVAVPIWRWAGQDGAPRFLCQATDDGRAPAFSVFADSESSLLDQVDKQLRAAD
jgi:hypothetical protein